MKTDEMLLFGGIALGALLLLTKGRAGQYIGETAGAAVTGSVVGVVEGVDNSIKRLYKRASTDKDFFAWMDPAAKGAVWLKQLGNDDRWLW